MISQEGVSRNLSRVRADLDLSSIEFVKTKSSKDLVSIANTVKSTAKYNESDFASQKRNHSYQTNDEVPKSKRSRISNGFSSLSISSITLNTQPKSNSTPIPNNDDDITINPLNINSCELSKITNNACPQPIPILQEKKKKNNNKKITNAEKMHSKIGQFDGSSVFTAISPTLIQQNISQISATVLNELCTNHDFNEDDKLRNCDTGSSKSPINLKSEKRKKKRKNVGKKPVKKKQPTKGSSVFKTVSEAQIDQHNQISAADYTEEQKCINFKHFHENMCSIVVSNANLNDEYQCSNLENKNVVFVRKDDNEKKVILSNEMFIRIEYGPDHKMLLGPMTRELTEKEFVNILRWKENDFSQLKSIMKRDDVPPLNDRTQLTEEQVEELANDYPPLKPEQRQQICQWISGKDTGTVLISKFNLSITRHDIQTLQWHPLTWLNDEVINFYMELLAERSRTNDNLPKVHSMNTFFLKRLMENGYSNVRKWFSKVDIFAHDIIPVPVHKGIHWCMAIIHIKNKTIKYYDSMGAPNNAVLNALSDYLKAESLDKKKVELDMSNWTMENVRKIPQQENGSDCGVFSCMYAEFITRNRPIVFSHQHMPYFRMKMVYEICTGQILTE